MKLLVLCLFALPAADFDTATVERLRVEVQHELYTEIDTVCSQAHWREAGGWWVLRDSVLVWYDRVEQIGVCE